MNHPTNLHGSPSLHQIGVVKAQEPVPVVPRPVLPRVVPTMTIGADHLALFNAEAGALLIRLGIGICMHAPPVPRPGCRPAPWALSTGTCKQLLHRLDQPGQYRVRLPAADCPPAGRYVLTPIAADAGRYHLLPV